MGETEQMAELARRADNNARRTYSGGSREEIESRGEAERDGRMDQAATQVIAGMGLHAEQNDDVITVMAAGWAVQHGWSSESARTIGHKALARIRKPHLYGPMVLHVNTPQDKYSVRMQDLQQTSREALANRIVQIIGDPTTAARIVRAICEGL